MSIFINDICVGLHSKCNWNCVYCVAHWTDATIDEDRILSQLLPIKNKLETLWISGGEPGLLSAHFWDRLFYETKFPLSICTNGTFIVREFVDKFRNNIRRVMLHCVEELDQNITPRRLDFIMNDPIDKEVNIVVHKGNVEILGEFLSKYECIDFNLNFADQTFAEINRNHNKSYPYALDRESIISIIKQLTKFKKYGKYTSHLTNRLIKNNFKHLNSWSYKNLEKK